MILRTAVNYCMKHNTKHKCLYLGAKSTAAFVCRCFHTWVQVMSVGLPGLPGLICANSLAAAVFVLNAISHVCPCSVLFIGLSSITFSATTAIVNAIVFHANSPALSWTFSLCLRCILRSTVIPVLHSVYVYVLTVPLFYVFVFLLVF